MTAVKPSRSCPECRYGGTPGVHWVEPDDERVQPYSVACPAKAAADEDQRLQKIATEHKADEHSKAAAAARAIIRDAAQTRAEFSANTIRQIFEESNPPVPPSLIGYAFRWGKAEGLIEETGRFVQSTEHSTRHRIGVWQSLVYGRARAHDPDDPPFMLAGAG